MPRLPILLITALVAIPLPANENSYRALQSGSTTGPTPVHAHGIHGEGQVIAFLDTGLDWDHCGFAEADNSEPPVNTATRDGALQTSNVDTTRRKVIAYDFLYSCAQFPGAPGCDGPSNPKAYDNQGHGTHAASSAAADKAAPILHDFGDAIAPGAKIVVQDAGYVGGDLCSQRPGLQCPLRDLRPVLEQAYVQGARIHSNSWSDRQGAGASTPAPTGNYSSGARDIDDFVWNHPDMVVVFNTGNAGNAPSSLSSPGSAKNTIDVGGMTWGSGPGEETIVSYSGAGPTRDNRLKPDLVGPANVYGGDSDLDVRTRNCNAATEGGTSWSSPTLAGVAALVRQYYADGFHPSGAPVSWNRFNPSAALVKATMIAAARPVRYKGNTGDELAAPTPSYEQGWGLPVLDDALYFAGDARRLLAFDVPRVEGLTTSATWSVNVRVRAGTPFRVFLVWTDPAGVVRGVSDSTPELVNDLDLTVTDPSGRVIYGNDSLHPGQPDRVNNVEGVKVDAPAAGMVRVVVTPHQIATGPRQDFAVVVTGDVARVPVRSRAVRR